MVCGGWDGHEPVESIEVLIPFLEAEGFDVRVEGDTAVYADADYMRGVDLVVQVNTMTTIEKAELEGLIDAVKAGTGLAGWHRRQLPQRGRLPAPDRRPVRLHAGIEPSLRTGEQSDNYLTYTIELTDLARTHPILEGIDDFELTTEQYWVLNDEYNDVLTTTTQEVRPWDAWNRHVTAPAIWTRQCGKGRVFVSAPGHELWHPNPFFYYQPGGGPLFDMGPTT